MADAAPAKNLDEAEYWERFGRGWLDRDQCPTPREAADTVLALHAQVRDLEARLADAKATGERERLACQQAMRSFSDEVQALTDKWRRV